MKTLHYRWNRSLNWIFTTLLGFLGFSSCEDNGDDPGNIICMYGTPTASYTIKGKVTDQAGQALSDIQIIVSDMEFSYEPRYPLWKPPGQRYVILRKRRRIRNPASSVPDRYGEV